MVEKRVFKGIYKKKGLGVLGHNRKKRNNRVANFLVMARYGRGGKRWIRYDTAQNIAIRYDMIQYSAKTLRCVSTVQD